MFIMRFDLRNPDFAGVSMADRYAAVLEMAEWGERNGALAISLSEHHGSADGYLPSPIVMAAAIAARTTNVIIGINALVVPFHDPIRLAEDLAVLDQLCRGRLQVTFAAGYAAHEFEMFGVDPGERPARMEEAIATLRAAWKGRPFEFRGREVMVRPTPAQDGGPPLIMGGSSDPAARRAARIGDGFIPSDAACWGAYRAECLALGKADPGESMPVNASVTLLALDPDAAWEALGPYLLHESNAYGAWAPTAGDAAYQQVESIDELRAGDQYRIVTPRQFAAELADDPLGFARLHPMVGGLPPELAWEQLRLYEEHLL